MKRIFILVGMLFIIVLSAVVAFSMRRAAPDNIEFLKSYGWEVEAQPIETADVTLPASFDAVYENYNKLQLEAGLDLRPYAGKSGKRYTYLVKNYPGETSLEVRANVLVIDGSPVAGDICTVNLDGFMHSLQFNR